MLNYNLYEETKQAMALLRTYRLIFTISRSVGFVTHKFSKKIDGQSLSEGNVLGIQSMV